MKPFCITIDQGGERKTAEGRKEATLREILAGAGVLISAPCGGRGRCGKCRVKIKGPVSPPTEEEKRLLSVRELEEGTRLACLTHPAGDIELRLPEETQMVVELGLGSDASAGDDFDPPVTGRMPGGGIAEAGSADLTDGAKEELRRYAGAAQPFAITHNGSILDIRPTVTPVIGMAVDIGTTTLAAQFYDLMDGCLLGSASAVNPQAPFGADVISRIAACKESQNSLERLQTLLLCEINRMAGAFCKDAGCARSDICSCVLAGNTAMLHIAAGLDPSPLAVAPYTPASLFGYESRASEAGIDILPGAPVCYMPCVSAYVGGDITAGLLACGFDRGEEPRLLIDLGTNGEMALRRGDSILCCSTAAGPVFEGAHIRDGVGSVQGAVSKVDVVGGRPVIRTISGKKPVGICGSGLIDAVAAMLRLGVIDETGRFDEAVKGEGAAAVVTQGGEPKFVIDPGAGIGVTQKDIREVQLAKAAVAAGIATMLKVAGIGVHEIRRVYIAGGLGTHISPGSACRIGLIPSSLQEKIIAVGNTAVVGASSLLRSGKSRERLKKIINMCHTVELSGNSDFNEYYIDHMCF